MTDPLVVGSLQFSSNTFYRTIYALDGTADTAVVLLPFGEEKLAKD
jgi:hypothetical protein